MKKKTKILIREANKTDLSVLFDLVNSDTNLFGEIETGYEEADVIEYITDPRRLMLVCVSDSIAIGCLLAELHDTYSYLEMLVIREDFQGKGIGTILLSEYEKMMHERGIPLVEVMTEINNQKMKSLLNKFSYKEGNMFIFFSKEIP